MGLFAKLFALRRGSPQIVRLTAMDMAVSWGTDLQRRFQQLGGGAFTVRYTLEGEQPTTVVGVKLDRAQCKALVGNMPMEFRFLPYPMPSGVILALGFRFFDQPDDPLAIENLIDPVDETSIDHIRLAARGPTLYMPLVDGAGECIVTKVVRIVDKLSQPFEAALTEAKSAAKKASRHDFRAAQAEFCKKYPPGHMFKGA